MTVIDGEVLAVVDEPTTTARVVTWEQATDVAADVLADRWRAGAEVTSTAAVAEALERLAITSGLASHLEDATPAQMHTALLTGASREQVAAAYGTSVAEARGRWESWASGRRQQALLSPPGELPAWDLHEAETVARRWAG